eukprot:scaffold544014_cov52-Prasinocladus_malaysianus.AAC.1
MAGLLVSKASRHFARSLLDDATCDMLNLAYGFLALKQLYLRLSVMLLVTAILTLVTVILK